MRSATRCLLLAGMTLAVVPSCFLQLRAHRGQITRHARGGEEVDIKVKGETAQLTEEPKSSGVDLLGLVLGGVVGLAVAAGKAVESFLNKKAVRSCFSHRQVGAPRNSGDQRKHVPAMVSKLFVLLALAVAQPDDIELGLSAETFAAIAPESLELLQFKQKPTEAH
eukprot:g2717.t1